MSGQGSRGRDPANGLPHPAARRTAPEAANGTGSGPALGPERRAEGLAAAARVDRAGLLALAEPIAARADVTVDAPPEPRTVMAVLDSPVGPRCLTEVVVTTTTVTVAGFPGWGCVLGWDAEAALAAALADAADPAGADRLAAAALRAEERERADRAARARATRMEVA
ncbi:hypothetical protein I6A84_35155 [Frankia sp. CNm7]|uniref:Phosphonate C-P lyase system protein PhnG n=1 Tax=Frankia nepalensis TaxID=1836974 RepID=A0A937UQC2_9ACTN|nr:hypothetical protein [Frankia nepalensis]MBL7497808.1 hypothetical protein [Frankia nepalensis]MBL7512662.1 hypothetical protein [Frankia nepalensis]MBL7523187.1 hypothetical protein [Frankia nepalensis]MBL7631709.1 hypothetical protein [Frankia nepalensis]